MGWSPGFVRDPSLHTCVDVSGLIAAGNAQELFVGCIECMDQMCFFCCSHCTEKLLGSSYM